MIDLMAVLNHHYNCLQAIALKEALPEAYDDTVRRPPSKTSTADALTMLVHSNRIIEPSRNERDP